MASTISAGTTSGTAIAIAGDTSGALALQTNNGTTAVTVDTSQNVGIGTTSPASKLHVYGATDSKLTLQNSNNSCFVGNLSGSMYIQSADIIGFNTAGATERMRIDTNGYVNVGCTANRGGSTFTLSTDSGTTRWAVGPWISNAGQFYISSSGSTGVYLSSTSATSWSSNSDERIKENLVPITDALNKVNTLRTVTGNYIEDESKTSHAFLIAQDILPVLPEAVDTSNPEKYGVAYSELIPLLTAAIKELNAKVEAQAATIATLQAKVGA
jgi:Chaperone of endosialidase